MNDGYATTAMDRLLISRALEVASEVAVDEAGDQAPDGMFYLGRRLIETALRMVLIERYPEFTDAAIEETEELLAAFAGPHRLAEFQREHDVIKGRGTLTV
jgi:hypothetical protein